MARQNVRTAVSQKGRAIRVSIGKGCGSSNPAMACSAMQVWPEDGGCLGFGKVGRLGDRSRCMASEPLKGIWASPGDSAGWLPARSRGHVRRKRVLLLDHEVCLWSGIRRHGAICYFFLAWSDRSVLDCVDSGQSDRI
jgi:hypothetical protein